MLANSTSYSHSHNPHSHAYIHQSIPSTTLHLENMNGWNRDYDAPREPAGSIISSSSRPTFHHHASSTPSIHEVSGQQTGGLTLSHSTPALPFPASWGSEAQHQHHNLTSSNSSPSLVFDHGMAAAAAAESNNGNNFAYNNSASNSSASFRSGYPSNAMNNNKTAYGSHSMASSNNTTFSNIQSPSPHAAAAMYHQQQQQQQNVIPPYHHYNATNTVGSTGAPLANGMVDVGMTDEKDRRLEYPSSAPTNDHHYRQHSHHHFNSSPNLSSEYNSEHRSSHLQHAFEVKHRRRTTRTQFKVLESTFRENPKPNASVRKSVSQQLDMPVRAVQIWFQNRRAKAKALAKREAGQSGDLDQDDEEDLEYNADQSQFLETAEDDDGSGRRYSSSPTSSMRPFATSSSSSSTKMRGSYNTPISTSSETFKVPNRPLRIDTDSSNRRMTTGAMPSSGTFTGNTFYHSPPLSSSGSIGPYSSHLSNSSPSFDSTSSYAARPVSASFSSTPSANYDERYRRGVATSPGVLQQQQQHQHHHQHDAGSGGVSMDYPTMTSHRQSLQSFLPHQQQSQYHHQQAPPQHHQQQQQQHHHHHSQHMDFNLPSAFDPETRRLSLPENVPAEMQLNLPVTQHQQQQQHYQHNQHQGNTATEYWRY